MSHILTNGFQPIDVSIFRPKSISKGVKLVKSFHVSGVKEIIDGNHRHISGLVLRETPGAQSTLKNENIYSPIVEIDQENGRSVVNSHCTCKAGVLFCKHAAALCVFVNEENTTSKTDEPMIWNRPPEQQLRKYTKGCTIESLFPSKKGNIPHKTFYTFENVENVSANHREENCAMIAMLKAEEICIQEKENRENFKRIKEASYRELFSKLLDLQKRNIFKIYNYFEYQTLQDGTRQLNKIMCPEDYSSFYSSNIEINEQQWIDVCWDSLNQSQTAIWFEKRRVRITCSEKAHQIKTRRKDYESLAIRFRRDSHKKITNKAMCYGLELESYARDIFSKLIQREVYETGLIISLKQPFLACSPDGFIFNGTDFELLEIKCPYSCKDSMIVDFLNRKSFVTFLKVNENDNKLELVTSHKYYTQVQVSMYVTAVKFCHFFVYSRLQFVYLQIARDEEFLSTLIPKIEQFYFLYYIQSLGRRMGEQSE